jgi:hypothetical protein
MTLSEAFARLPVPKDEWDACHALGPIPVGATTLASANDDDEKLAMLLARKQAQARGGDVQLGCAYLTGDLGWEIGRILGGLWLEGWKVRAIDPGAVAVSPREVAWEEDGETGTSVVMDMTFDPAGMVGGGTEPADLARGMTGMLSPLVTSLARLSRLGAAAQWRLVADGLAGALIHHGRAQGRMAEAVLLGRAIAADGGTSLRSRKLAFVEIACPGQPDVTDWYRLRGGCCRYYTASGESGEYCTTCVHRDRADQIARLSDYLERVNSPHPPEEATGG